MPGPRLANPESHLDSGMGGEEPETRPRWEGEGEEGVNDADTWSLGSNHVIPEEPRNNGAILVHGAQRRGALFPRREAEPERLSVVGQRQQRYSRMQRQVRRQLRRQRRRDIQHERLRRVVISNFENSEIPDRVAEYMLREKPATFEMEISFPVERDKENEAPSSNFRCCFCLENHDLEECPYAKEYMPGREENSD